MRKEFCLCLGNIYLQVYKFRIPSYNKHSGIPVIPAQGDEGRRIISLRLAWGTQEVLRQPEICI